MDIQNDNDDSKIIYTTERGKFIRKYLLSQPSKSQEAKKRTANKFDSVNSNGIIITTICNKFLSI